MPKTTKAFGVGPLLISGILLALNLSGQTIAQGRAQINYTSAGSGSGCGAGPYTALFNIQALSGDYSDGNTWAQIVTNLMNSYQQGDSSPSGSGDITGSVQLSGACVGTFTLDPTSNWYMQLDAQGWHFYFYWLLTSVIILILMPSLLIPKIWQAPSQRLTSRWINTFPGQLYA
jgi:hypothetical protein